MAKGQQRIGSITVWMIVFVALWLTSSVFLVILYTGQEELKNENDRLRTANSRLISASEERSLELARSAQPSGPTVVGLLEQARRDTAFLATGNEDDGPPAVLAKRNQLVTSIRSEGLVSDPRSFTDVSLFEALSALYESYKSQHDLLATAKGRVEHLDAEVAKLVELNASQKADFDERAAQFEAQLREAEATREAARAEYQSALERLGADLDAHRTQCNSDLTRERQRGAALERSLTELQERFAAREERFGSLLPGPEELATARTADGTILTAVPGDGVVYIDLGRNDGVVLGLQFAVYSRDLGIPTDGKSKAQIEVVSVSESSAECRIVRVSPGHTILSDDLIANPVFDPRRRLTFLAIGGFDFDHDGEVDDDSQATVEALVTRWGGRMTDELDALTDFVIIGVPPRQPRPASEVSAEQQARNQALKEAWERYNELLSTARALSVPIMTQEVFLNFLGYALR